MKKADTAIKILFLHLNVEYVQAKKSILGFFFSSRIKEFVATRYFLHKTT